MIILRCNFEGRPQAQTTISAKPTTTARITSSAESLVIRGSDALSPLLSLRHAEYPEHDLPAGRYSVIPAGEFAGVLQPAHRSGGQERLRQIHAVSPDTRGDQAGQRRNLPANRQDDRLCRAGNRQLDAARLGIRA